MDATTTIPCDGSNGDVPRSIPGSRWIFRKFSRHCERCRVTHPAGLNPACDYDVYVYQVPAGYVFDVTADIAEPYDTWTAREQAAGDQAERERESAALDRQIAIATELLLKARKRVIYKTGGTL